MRVRWVFGASPCRRLRRVSALCAVVALAGCVQAPTRSGADAGTAERILGRSDRYLVVKPAAADDYRALAARHLGDSARYWWIEDANQGRPPATLPGVVIPLQEPSPGGFREGGFQTVPVLAYHKLGDVPAPMTVTAVAFEAQMRYLRDHGYRVVSLADFSRFIEGRAGLPARAVVITFDDGHQSIYRIAYPILKRYGYPATLFMYSDYIENGGLTWAQLKEMAVGGIFTIQPHSRTHGNLAVRWEEESGTDYARRVADETRTPGEKLAANLGNTMFAFAYPYGDANDTVIAELEKQGYAMGLTVMPGSNAAFAPPFLLRRSMIFGDRDMDAFRDALGVWQDI